MICPNCNKTLPDESVACNFCGHLLNQSISESNTGKLMTHPTNTPQVIQKNPEQAGAELELRQINEGGAKTASIAGIGVGALFIIGGIILLKFIIILAGIIILVLGIVKFVEINSRIEELNKIASGRKIVSVCPMCKSPNIQIGLVETGSTAIHGVSTVGQNINPLRPFTHTNIRQGDTYTSNSYGSKGVCLNCGCTFDEPEKFFM